jgi:hypothetical protein
MFLRDMTTVFGGPGQGMVLSVASREAGYIVLSDTCPKVSSTAERYAIRRI